MFSSLGLMFVKLMFFAIEIRLCARTQAHTGKKGKSCKREEREINFRQRPCISINPAVYTFTLFILVSELGRPTLFAHNGRVLADVSTLES